jgi:hypothetical protein
MKIFKFSSMISMITFIVIPDLEKRTEVVGAEYRYISCTDGTAWRCPKCRAEKNRKMKNQMSSLDYLLQSQTSKLRLHGHLCEEINQKIGYQRAGK